MRGWLAVTCFCSVGCAPPGLALEVTTSDPAIRRVELFVGATCDLDCPASVAPPGLTEMSTDVYPVLDARPWPAPVVDGVAGFELHTDTDQNVPIIVAVGFDAPEGGHARAVATLHDVAIPAREPAHWQMPLSPASALDNQGPVIGTERVAVWRQAAAPGLACVMVEHGADKRDLVVPHDDPDCDQLPANECAPWTHLAVNAGAELADASCLIRTTNRPDVQVCMLGGPTCNETGGGTTNACQPLGGEACVPSSFCDACPAWDVTCITNQIQLTSGNTGPSVDCRFPVMLDGSPCNSGEAVARMDAGPFLGYAPVKCQDIGVNVVATPLGAFGHSLAIDNAKLEIKNTNAISLCSFDVVLSGKVTTGVLIQPLLLDLSLDNAKHLVLPFRVQYVANCLEQAYCGMSVTNDAMFACAQPPLWGKCQGQMLNCGGPNCGDTCCGAGESCVNGQCHCGTGPSCGGYPWECHLGPIGGDCGSMCCNNQNILCDF